MRFAKFRRLPYLCLLATWWILPAHALEVHEGNQAQHTTSLSRRQKSRSRGGGRSLSVEIDPAAHRVQLTTPLEDMSSEYTGYIGVGTKASGGPQFQARVVFDTGSTNLWVASILCKAYPCDEQNDAYDPASSTTSEEFEGEDDGFGHDIDIMFGTGELKGPLHIDTYHVGPMEVKHQPFAMIREMSGEVFASFQFEGILGLAFPSLSFGGIKPFFERVIEQKLLKRNEFAFYLNADSNLPSALLWGGVDKDLYEGDIVMFPVKKAHYWALDLVDFRIGNRSLVDEKHFKAKYLIVDTGTTYFTAPSSIYDTIIETFAEAPCSEVGSYVPLTYVLRSASGETFDLEVTQQTYMVGDDSDSCMPAFMKLDVKKQYGPAMILGEVFMRHFFTVFSRGNGDVEEAKVGFAKAKLGARPKGASKSEATVQTQEASLMRRNPEP